MDVVDSASRLFDLLASHDTTFTKHLQPGLPREEIARLVAPTGIQLPEEVIAFYSKFNLPRINAYNTGIPAFYGIYWLLGLEDAVDELLNSRRELWNEFFPPEDFPENSGWFPLLQEDANLYVLDTANTKDGKCFVLKFSEYDGPSPAFDNLGAMFETLYAWADEGVLTVEDGHVVGAYKGDPQRVAKIAARINPGVERWRNQ